MTSVGDDRSDQDKARAAFEAAFERGEAGDQDAAVALYRQAAVLGHSGARINLAYLLTESGPQSWAEGMRWYRRGARSGDSTAAMNLAMEYRLRGNRRRYFHWLRAAARMGNESAQKFLRVIQGVRARGGRAPMLFLDEADAWSVLQTLDKFLAGELTREAASEWATLIMRGEAALGPYQSRQVAQVIEELADHGRHLTKRRARELICKLA
jgi:hypothetical protein